jgi:hypothetical protein
MPLRYTYCAICDRPVARYKMAFQYFCSTACYSTFRKMLSVAIRDKKLREEVKARALELSRIAA